MEKKVERVSEAKSGVKNDKEKQREKVIWTMERETKVRKWERKSEKIEWRSSEEKQSKKVKKRNENV